MDRFRNPRQQGVFINRSTPTTLKKKKKTLDASDSGLYRGILNAAELFSRAGWDSIWRRLLCTLCTRRVLRLLAFRWGLEFFQSDNFSLEYRDWFPWRNHTFGAWILWQIYANLLPFPNFSLCGHPNLREYPSQSSARTRRPHSNSSQPNGVNCSSWPVRRTVPVFRLSLTPDHSIRNFIWKSALNLGLPANSWCPVGDDGSRTWGLLVLCTLWHHV